MAKFLITGVAGFIGSNLARTLTAQGHEVRGVDDFSTGKRHNLDDLAGKIDFTEMSILEAERLTGLMKGVDFVLHQAAIPSVPRSVADPVMTHNVNVTGTLNVLLASRDAKVRRVIYAASSSAYGDTPTLPKHEGMVPNPISPYAGQKLAGEHYMASFYKCYGLETVSLRYFNVFGPYQDPSSQYSGVLAKFSLAMLRGEQPMIFGDGEQSRDFTYIADVVQANLKACEAPADKAAGRVFNIAVGTRTTLNETFRILAELTGYKGKPAYGPDRAGDVKHSLADISATRSALGYDPKFSFRQGLEQTVAWYKSSVMQTASSGN